MTLKFLSILRKKNVRIWASDGELHLSAPDGVLTADLRAELSAREAEILSLLRESAGTDAIKPVGRQGPQPLSYAQQRLFFLYRLAPDSLAYNIPLAFHLFGPLNIPALQSGLDEIVRRHESLRSTFAEVNNQPVQIIAPHLAIAWQLHDLQHLPVDERWAESRRQVDRQAACPFDLENGPLLRASLWCLDADEHVLLIAVHHIIWDGWSNDVFYREISALYSAAINGQPCPLAALPIQYADYAAWQRERLRGPVRQEQLAYWKRQLEDADPVLQLATDHPRPMSQTYRGAICTRMVSQALYDRLVLLGRQAGATSFITVLAAFQTLLHRYTGQDQIIVGSPIANRTRADTEGLIGFFANTVPLRGDFSGMPTFRGLMERAREAALGAYAHQELPFEELIDALRLARDPVRSPLVQVMFVMENTARQSLELSGLRVVPFDAHAGGSVFDLTLLARESSGLELVLEYNNDLFERDTMERLLGHLEVLLESFVAQPDTPVCQVPMLTERELKQISAWNETRTAAQVDRCIHQLFEAQVERSPDAIALCFEDRQVSYHELNARANRLARYLVELGIGADDTVGICMERSPEMVVSVLGVLKAGGAYVPLDPVLPAERLQMMAVDTRARVILTQTRWTQPFARVDAVTVCVDAGATTFSRYGENNLDRAADPDRLAYVIYTSGSTGIPKGVMVSHRAAGNLLQWALARAPLGPGDSVLQQIPFYFDPSVAELFSPLVSGARLVLAAPGGQRDGEYLARMLAESNITTVWLVPSTLRLVVQDDSLAQCHSLRQVFCGGEVLPGELRDQFLAASHAELINLYGPTETTVASTAFTCHREHSGLSGRIPVGRPIANTIVRILDGNAQPVPIGVPGHLHIGGAGLARGYLRRADLTAEKFVPDGYGLDAGARLYCTGDLARYLPTGDLDFVGRSDSQVKLRGFRIELGEIEATLRRIPAVKQAAVIVRTDAGTGARLVAYVVPIAPGASNAHDLRRELKTKLPEYMVPVAFVFVDAIPVTSTGKIDLRALPAPDRNGTDLGEPRELPATDMELKTAAIWQEILGLDRVGRDDNFFDLGGHSLLIVQVRSKLSSAIGRDIPVADLFRFPTVRSLAEYLSDSGDAQPSRLRIEERAEKRLQARDRHARANRGEQPR